MTRRQWHFDCRANRRFVELRPFVLPSLSEAKQFRYREAVGLFSVWQFDLQSVVLFNRTVLDDESYAVNAVIDVADAIDAANVYSARAQMLRVRDSRRQKVLVEELCPRPREDGFDVEFRLRLLCALESSVEQFPVVVRDGCDIERRFFAPFDFQRDNARFLQLRQHVWQRQILHGHRAACVYRLACCVLYFEFVSADV